MPLKVTDPWERKTSFMKGLIFACFLVLGGGNSFAESPCNSKTYLELNSRNPDSLSRREFTYLVKHKKWCSEASRIQTDKTDRQEPESGIAMVPVYAYLIVGTLLLLASFRF